MGDVHSSGMEIPRRANPHMFPFEFIKSVYFKFVLVGESVELGPRLLAFKWRHARGLRDNPGGRLRNGQPDNHMDGVLQGPRGGG